MLSALQSAIVTYLDGYEADPDAGDDVLAPKEVLPYGGELLRPNRLIDVVPAVFVELDQGDVERMGASERFEGDHRADVICAARNGASEGATLHDGARLMAWVIEAMKEAELVIEAQVLRARRITWRRLATDRKGRTWTGVLTIHFQTVS